MRTARPRSSALPLVGALLLQACASSRAPAPPDTTPPSVPQALQAVAIAPTRVQLLWTPSTDAGGAGLAGYQVLRDGALRATVSAPVAAFEDATAPAGTEVEYRVRAFDRAEPPNLSGESGPARVTTPSPGETPGLDTRPANPTCLAPARPEPETAAQLVRVFPALSFAAPVALLQAPGDGSRWFVVEQAGRVRAFANTPGVTSASTFVDISSRVTSGGETGLLGLAFHPAWPATPEVFLSYTSTGALRSIVSRFRSVDGGATLDPASEQILLTVSQPFANHNGGGVVFGPDGFLYAGLGDGGSGGDPLGNGQRLTTLLGKMLRIDVDGTGAGYAVPADNPYASNPGCPAGTGALPCPEIWAFGFRNPWRFSFDRDTGDLWVGDVGQNAWEEVDRVVKGGNYGWRFREGAHCYAPATGCPAPGTVQNGGVVIDPVTEYGHVEGGGDSITGGHVYRGAAIPALRGRYVFGDFVSGLVFTHEPGAPGLQKELLLASGTTLSSFGEDAEGELHALSYGDGRILRLVPSTPGGTDTMPASLAATGCVDPDDPTKPAPGLIPYGVEAPFWSDGAVKERFMALPDGAGIAVGPDGDLELPSGTVLVKSFRLGGALVETRLLVRHPDGEWAGYTYEWNAAQTGATRVVGGKTSLVGAQRWVFPSEQQCLQCHTQAAGRSLGLETAQLNGDLTYPATGRTANQLLTLSAIGLVALPGPPASLPAYPNPGGAGSLEARARAWLHANCSHCHRPGGPTPTALDLRYATPLAGTGACDRPPLQGDLGIGGTARLVAPGAPERSVLLERIRRLDVFRMPPLGSLLVDEEGARLVSDWIAALAACP